MTDVLNAGDGLWERIQRRFPILYQLDNTAAKSWLTHSVVVLVAGLLLAWASSWIVAIPLRWCWRIFVALYLVREILNARAVKRSGRPPNYVDHVGDVVVPLAITEIVGALL